MEFGDGVCQENPAHGLVRGMSGSLVPTGRAAHPDYATGSPLRVAQVGQSLNDLAEPFGRTTSSPLKSALAFFTSSSSASRSLMRCRARANSSGS